MDQKSTLSFEQSITAMAKALDKLGGSGSVIEVYDEVIQLENLDEAAISNIHTTKGGRSINLFKYRLDWARSYLKKAGYLEKSTTGVWSLTNKANQSKPIVGRDVIRYCSTLPSLRSLKSDTESVNLNETEIENEADKDVDNDFDWRKQLQQILIEEMSPDSFERLTQRILRESGFIQVKVTGRSGDGGIDGEGIARINGLISFRIAFQCKKYKGTVGPAAIRDFRGASNGKADRALFITTGSFTKDAIQESTRDGAERIDLIDGEQLLDKLRELSLGVKTEQVERITIDSKWFLDL